MGEDERVTEMRIEFCVYLTGRQKTGSLGAAASWECWLQCDTVCLSPGATERVSDPARLTVCFDDGVRVAAEGE